MADGLDRSNDPGCRRVLVVDDDLEFAEALQILLASKGYEAETANSAAAAKQRAKSFAAEIALVDIRLGQTNGINLLGDLRQAYPNILCVIMTAYASADTAIDALHGGAYDYLCKPFHSSDLWATLDRCFKQLNLAREKKEVEADLRTRNEELQQINERMRTAVDSMRALTSCTNLRDFCPRVLEAVVSNLGAAGGSLYLMEGERLVLCHGLDCGPAPETIPLPLEDDSLFGQALTTREPVLLPESGAGAALPGDWTRHLKGSLLGFPLLHGGDGQPIGALSLHARPGIPFTPQDRELGLVLVSSSCETVRVVKALENLAISEERFRTIVENSTSAILLKDLEDHILLVNRRYEEWYGRAAADVVGRTTYEVYPKEYADAFVSQDIEVVETNAAVEREFDLPFADGSIHTILITKFPVLDTNGGAMGIGTVGADVTDRRQMEKQLRQAQKMEALGQLTGGVAHDFNNLLAIIVGNLDLLEEQMDGGGKDPELVDDALEAARRGADLTRRLLAFGRRQTLHPEVTDVGDLVRGMFSLLARTLGETIEIETVSSGALPKTMVDQGQLEIALLNLAVNARDAMPEGGRLTIETGCVEPGDDGSGLPDRASPGRHVMLAMHDTGTGMTAQAAAHAFEPFFTTKDVGHGSGLGLSMVYGFVRQSGGHVVLDSIMGRGTTVRIFLPESDGEIAPHRPDPNAASEPRGMGEAVLVVEDEPGVRKLAAEMLTRLGYAVSDAADGCAALALFDEGANFDLLYTDIILPGGMSGVQLAREARGRNPGLKVLYVSGYATDTQDAAAVRDQGAKIVNKPFRKETLAQVVREALDR